jgi:hypothetical protein
MQNAEVQVLGAFLIVCILNSAFCIDADGLFIRLRKAAYLNIRNILVIGSKYRSTTRSLSGMMALSVM